MLFLPNAHKDYSYNLLYSLCFAPELMWWYLRPSTNTSLTCDYSVTLESHSYQKINFTYLLPGLGVREQTMAAAARSNRRAQQTPDGFPSPEARSNPGRAAAMHCYPWIICHLQPVLTSHINITTTDKILAGLRIQMDPGCEYCAGFRSPLQS